MRGGRKLQVVKRRVFDVRSRNIRYKRVAEDLFCMSNTVLNLLALLVQKHNAGPAMYARHGTQFACFTRTKVQILTQKAVAGPILLRGAQKLSSPIQFTIQFTCFTGTKVQVLTQLRQDEFSCWELSFDQLHLQRGLCGSRWRGELRNVSGGVQAVEWISRLYRLCSRQVPVTLVIP